MSIRTGTSHRRRRLIQLAAVALLVSVAAACNGTWGLRSSYRSYVAGPIGGGAITVEDGVVWLDGAGPGKGPFRWPLESATFDPVTETGTLRFDGGVGTAAHATPDGYVLKTSFWNPRLEIDGDAGTIYVDLTFRPFNGTAPTELPPRQSVLDVAFATVDLSAVDWTPNASGYRQIVDAPTTGITEAMELIGWDLFYGDPVALDPFSATFNTDVFAPAIAPAPRITVSETDGLRPGDTVIVTGEGFDPTINLGTRPPLTGQPAGAYVVFGRFPDTWQPSAGVPTSARTVLAQRWALGAASRALLDPAGTNPSYVTIDEHGSFTATLTVAEGGTAGNYGFYTYAGSGAVNPDHELAELVTLAPAP